MTHGDKKKYFVAFDEPALLSILNVGVKGSVELHAYRLYVSPFYLVDSRK